MPQYQKATDTEHSEKLTSEIVTAAWVKKMAFADDPLPYEIWTQFVGDGADITLKVVDQKSKSVGTVKGKVFGNRFAGQLVLPDKPLETVRFTAKLPKHKLKAESNVCRILPPVQIANQKWDRKEARRGDVVKLTADTENIADGEQLMLMIYEYDQDGAHDFIAKFPHRVRENKIEADWEYEYHEDADEIPNETEMKAGGRSYSPPEYFWVADLHGKKFGQAQESGLLEFKDWLEIELRQNDGNPRSDEQYILTLADGSEKRGTLDKNGTARIEDLPPGPYTVKFPNAPGIELRG